jgi:hypothetical protein
MHPLLHQEAWRSMWFARAGRGCGQGCTASVAMVCPTAMEESAIARLLIERLLI